MAHLPSAMMFDARLKLKPDDLRHPAPRREENPLNEMSSRESLHNLQVDSWNDCTVYMHVNVHTYNLIHICILELCHPTTFFL